MLIEPVVSLKQLLLERSAVNDISDGSVIEKIEPVVHPLVSVIKTW